MERKQPFSSFVIKKKQLLKGTDGGDVDSRSDRDKTFSREFFYLDFQSCLIGIEHLFLFDICFVEDYIDEVSSVTLKNRRFSLGVKSLNMSTQEHLCFRNVT
ncbi:hypothetical protein NPIL_171971 [Nephila pilipes]|uniref:Uncharacterized protein n=1 Tax=Nephila pilipes TaxID=299642 RepID=A0A8X6TAC1_NEPPI|nr:hypothetical protein NPIL_171971 [Nephila pilipes]